LKEDGANLASLLLNLQEHEPEYYRIIVDTLRMTVPFFAGFELEPEFGSILLRWREKGSSMAFDSSQAADGMLRMMALVTLFSLPKDQRPKIFILDEPELGLHPYAINILGALIKSASLETQVIIATQSTTLIDCFDPKDIVVVERHDRESVFRRLEPEKLEMWLEEYSLSDLWLKNVLGGRPR